MPSRPSRSACRNWSRTTRGSARNSSSLRPRLSEKEMMGEGNRLLIRAFVSDVITNAEIIDRAAHPLECATWNNVENSTNHQPLSRHGTTVLRTVVLRFIKLEIVLLINRPLSLLGE